MILDTFCNKSFKNLFQIHLSHILITFASLWQETPTNFQEELLVL